MNDCQLVEGLRRRDPAAVRHLNECYLPSVWRFVCVRVRGDRHLAEDIVSETVLALIKAVAVPETEIHSPSAWLRSVALHKLQDHFRAAARVQHLIDQATSDSAAGKEPDPAGREEANERRAAVRRVMDDLPEQHRLALEWKYLDHLSVRAIAERMATTEKAVESILFRARREFRDGLGGLHPDDEAFSANGHGQPDSIDPSPVSGCAGSDARPDVETQQPAGFEDLKQRQSR